MNQVLENRKCRHSLTAYYWVKLRMETIILLYRHNRVTEAHEMMEQLQQDCKTFNDNYHHRLILEY